MFMSSYSGGSRPSAKEGARLAVNVEFCEGNSGTSKKMRYAGPSPRSVSVIFLLCCYVVLFTGDIKHILRIQLPLIHSR